MEIEYGVGLLEIRNLVYAIFKDHSVKRKALITVVFSIDVLLAIAKITFNLISKVLSTNTTAFAVCILITTYCTGCRQFEQLPISKSVTRSLDVLERLYPLILA